MATKYPPQASLSESVRIIKDIYKTHKSIEVSEDLLPPIFKVKQRSSNFPATIVALNRFGLIERLPKGIIRLTDLAMQIIKPFDNEDYKAKLTAAQNDDILSSLIDKYPNFVLPSPEQTQHTLVKLFNIDRNTVEKWYRFVVDSFSELSTKSNLTINNIENVSEEKTLQSPQAIATKGFQSFDLPSGKKFSFTLEDGITADDLDFIIEFLTLKKKRFEKTRAD